MWQRTSVDGQNSLWMFERWTHDVLFEIDFILVPNIVTMSMKRKHLFEFTSLEQRNHWNSHGMKEKRRSNSNQCPEKEKIRLVFSSTWSNVLNRVWIHAPFLSRSMRSWMNAKDRCSKIHSEKGILERKLNRETFSSRHKTIWLTRKTKIWRR